MPRLNLRPLFNWLHPAEESSTSNPQLQPHPKPKLAHDILTAAEAERLSLLLEECGEALQIIGKIQRHGYESAHPRAQTINNRYLLETELGHIMMAIETMVKNGDVSQTSINQSRDLKRISVREWLHFHHKGLNDM